MTAVSRRWALDSQLLLAIRNNDVNRAHQLFRAGVDTDVRFSINSQKRPALCICVENNATDMVQLLVQLGVSINQADSLGLTPLHLACSHGYTHIATFLLQSRAHVDGRSTQGRTPLHLAAIRGNEDLVELLLNHGANSSALDHENRSPLHWACAFANSPTVQVLLRAGASVRDVDIHGNTALHYAVDSGGVDCASVQKLALLNANSVCIANKNQQTPIHIAVRSGRSDAESILTAIVSSATKAAIDTPGRLGHTALHVAVLEQHETLVRLLLTAGADPNTENHLGHTPLVSSARNATWGTLALLLAGGARTQRLIQGGVVDRAVRDPAIRALLEDATRHPPKLSSICRRAVTRHLGPSSLTALQQPSLPRVWQQFLTFQSLNL